MNAIDDLIRGMLALGTAMKACNLDPSKATLVVSEEDGRRIEHMALHMDQFTISATHDPRQSKPKADKTIREFQIAGIKVQYRTKPFLLPSGDVI